MSKNEKVPEMRNVQLTGKDCALVLRENGLVEINLKMRKMNDKIDLEPGELFLVALNTLMKDKRWVNMVMNVDYANLSMNRG